MRTKLLSILLIGLFLTNSVLAQEVPVPETPAVEESVPEVIAPIEELPAPDFIEVLPAIEEISAPEVVETPPVIEEPKTEEASPTEPVIEEAQTFAEPLITEEVVAEPEPYVSLLIRYGENVAWSGTTTLPTSGTATASPTGSTTVREIPANSLLGVLLTLDATTNDFDITNLAYFPKFDSFLVNCIDSPAFTEACFQWQYVIDGQYPFVGADDYLLEDGDEIFVYFGSPRRVVLSDSAVTVNETFTATAQSYDPETDTYSALPGYTIGVTQPNPANPFSPIEIATSTSAADGTAIFALATEGTYDVGLQEDFYFPTTPLVVSSTSGSSGGGGSTNPETGFDIPAAYSLLVDGQNDDGSWESEIVTDWSAFSFALPGAPASTKSKLVSYLKEEEPSFESVRDYERHAIALMALNINPYTGGPEDYITPIVESFDGKQIDDPDLMNDDVFALIPLLHAGYTKNDPMIQSITRFVVSEQKNDGSWVNSVDVTAATVQALSQLRSLPGVTTALAKAEDYLHDAQQSDGGFGDPFVTAWTIQAIHALGQSPVTWKVGDNTPLTYLEDIQEEDGGLTTSPDDYSTRAWATTYAIPAVKGLTWDDILRDFRKPATAGNNEDNDEENEDEDQNTATTTDDIMPVTLPAPLEVEAVAPEPVMLAQNNIAATETLSNPEPETSVQTDTEEEVREPEPLVAGVGESGAWTWIKNFFHSLWQALVNLFT
jgi:hypothetical protein